MSTLAARPRPEEAARAVTTGGLHYRADIDGLRAVAVGLVLLYHAGVSVVSGGYVGVDVFFVISGFLITSALVTQGESGRVRLAAFYAGRMRRLLPLSTLALVVTCAFGLWLLPVAAATELLADARSALLYVANWRFADKSVAYVDTDVTDGMLTHFWSLSIEEQYYFGWPLLIALAARLRRSVPGRSLRAIVAGLAGLVVAVSLGWSIVATPTEGARAYYLTHLRLWEIAAGALVAVTVHRWPTGAWATPVRGVALVVIAVSACTFDAATPFPGSAAMVPVAAAVLLVGLGGRGGLADRILGWTPMRYVGERSYALYLWHWPALGVAALLDERHGWRASHWTLVAGAMVAAGVLSVVTHALVENPVRHSPRLRRLTAGTLVVGVASTLALVAAIAPVRDRKIELADQEWATAPMTPLEAVDDTVTARYRRCHQTLAAEFEQLRWCELGDPDADVTIVLAGDSHAQHWAPAFDLAGSRQGWRVLLTTRSACLPYGVPLWSERLSVMDGECAAWSAALRAELAAGERVDLLVIGRAFGYIDAVRTEGGDDVSTEAAGATIAAAVGALAASVGPRVGRLVVLEDTPWSRRSIPNCLDEMGRAAAAACDFPARDLPDETALLAAEVEGLGATGAPPATTLSLDELVCPAGTCPAVAADGTIAFRDASHLTASYSEAMADGLAELIGRELREADASG